MWYIVHGVQMKKFIITDGPSISDPAWLIVCKEVIEHNGTEADIVEYTSFKPIEEAIQQAKDEYQRFMEKQKEINKKYINKYYTI